MSSPRLDYLPLFLRINDQPALVVGGGVIATRKTELLLRAGARVTVVAPTLHAELQRLLAQSPAETLRHLESVFEPAQLDGATLAIAATDEEAVNAAVAAAAAARGIPVNVVDDPEKSSFILPAIVDRAPLIVAIGSGGESPVLARQVRSQIESLLPTQLGTLARFAGARRQRVRAALPRAARRPFWERLLQGVTARRVLDGRTKQAEAEFARELAQAQVAGPPAGEVYLIGAGPGDPDLLTLKALQLLQQADVIVYDRLVAPKILERARRDARRIDAGKVPGGPHPAQAFINAQLITLARQGLKVARLKGGDPFIFGRGGEEIAALSSAGIPFTVVPGITAALGAAAAAALPLTYRGVARAVTLVSAHSAGDDTLAWDTLARTGQTVVFYMGVAQLDRVVAKLTGAGAPPERPVAIVERATHPNQRILHSTLAQVVADARTAAIGAPALLIVGDVTALGAAAGLRDELPPQATDAGLRGVGS